MKVNLQVDAAPLILRLKDGPRRLAWAVVRAITKTLKRIQDSERARVRGIFTVRKEQFIMRQAAIIDPFPSIREARPYGEIAVGQKKRLLLSIFERGGTREPAVGKRLAIPIKGGPARPTWEEPVPEEFFFSKLKFRLKSGKRGKRVTESGLYLIPKVGVFKRVAGEESKLAFAFTGPKKLSPRLEFIQTAEAVANQWFGEEMERQALDALAHAGPPSTSLS